MDNGPSGYVDQYPDDLRLSLIDDNNPDLAQLRPLAHGTCMIKGVRVEATIIGASHVICFGSGPFLHEVFACISLPGVRYWQLSELVSEPIRHELDGLRYEFSVQFQPWESDDPLDLQLLCNAVAAKKAPLGLEYNFEPGNLGVTPKTVIVGYPDIYGSGAIIQTAHSYPGKGLVLSRTVIATT